MRRPRQSKSDCTSINALISNSSRHTSQSRTYFDCGLYFNGQRINDIIFRAQQANDKSIIELRKSVIRMEINLILRHRNRSYMITQLFDECVSTVLIPYIDGLHINEEFIEKEAILLMDNCSIHASNDILAELREHHMEVIIFPPRVT